MISGIGGGTPLARVKAMRAHRNAQAAAKDKHERKSKRRVARNDASSEGVHTLAVLFQTPHTKGPLPNSDTLPLLDTHRLMSNA